MTGKQRAFLRGLANSITVKYQIGKNGIDNNTISMIDEALEANELIKIRVLENSMLGVREACETVCRKASAFPVQCIGNIFVIYRESINNKKISISEK